MPIKKNNSKTEDNG